MNAIVGVWLGPTLYFLLATRSASSQLLSGLFADDPAAVGWLLLGYSLVFTLGVLLWSQALPYVGLRRALGVTLVAMLGVSLALLWLNHMRGQPLPLRWLLTATIALMIMVESGFTPAALLLLASAVGSGAGRGTAMGVYSFLLGLGALVGSILAGIAGRWQAIDGLIYVTLALTLAALGLLPRLAPDRL
jgi:MFS family permease